MSQTRGSFCKTLFIWLGLLIAVSITICLILLPLQRKHHVVRKSQAQELSALFDHSQMVLTSNKKYGEVHIPFTLRGELIRVRMIWSGKPVEAILDTGSGFVTWPRSLKLASVKTGIPQDGMMAANVVTHGEWTILPSIRAGNCEWHEIPTATMAR